MRVGTRVFDVDIAHNYGDHPHACGDKYESIPRNHVRGGSSPCVWGQEAVARSIHRLCRIIPMRVGTSNNITAVYACD